MASSRTNHGESQVILPSWMPMILKLPLLELIVPSLIVVHAAIEKFSLDNLII